MYRIWSLYSFTNFGDILPEIPNLEVSRDLGHVPVWENCLPILLKLPRWSCSVYTIFEISGFTGFEDMFEGMPNF